MRRFKRILLVDDDEVANFVSIRVLKKLGISEEVVVLYDGEEALEYVKQHYLKPNQHAASEDLILLDLNMPLMGGFEFLEHFNRLPVQSKVQICIVSSSSLEQDQKRASDFNVSGYISKPLSVNKLMTVLDNLG
jgi:CheY-like chemotaxis protein